VDALTQRVLGTDGGKGRVATDILKMRLDAYISTWITETLRPNESVGEIARSTRRDYEDTLRRYVVPYLGWYRIGDLTVQNVGAWIRTLRTRNLSDRTVQKAWRALHKALADSGLPTNPVALPGKDRPKVRQTRKVIRPTVDEVNGFLNHVVACGSRGGHGLSTLWQVAAVTGLRRSEMCGLAWTDLDLDSDVPVITVRRGLHSDRQGIYVGQPKSAASCRTVSIDDKTAGRLRDLARRRMTGPSLTVPVDGLTESFDPVFRWGSDDGPMRPDVLTYWFRKEWSHASLRPGVTLHGLRHSHGSALLHIGRPVTEVAARLGHDPDVLLRIYARDLDEGRRHEAMREATASLYGG
jgi:integrase